MKITIKDFMTMLDKLWNLKIKNQQNIDLYKIRKIFKQM